jgi:membrane associated rhomboid family serine protease
LADQTCAVRSADRHPFVNRRGGAAVDYPRREAQEWRPVATYWFLGLIAGVYALQLLTIWLLNVREASGLSAGTFWPAPYGEWGHNWHDFFFVIGTDWAFRPWTLVTSTLSHSPIGLQHLLFNGLFLFFFGPSVERLIGRARFVWLFLLGGAVAGIVQVHAVSWMAEGTLWMERTGALGASGALMLLMGILMVLTPKSTIYLMLFPVPLWMGGIIYAFLDIIGAFNPNSGIGNFAHLSGMAIGLMYGYWAKQDFQRRGLRIHYGP